jgi:hypothetical protein
MPLRLRTWPLSERPFRLGQGLAAVSEPPPVPDLQAANLMLDAQGRMLVID